jgi:hypothetical protein
MLGKWPIPNKLSKMSAWAKGLWIRRVLVRAQEGQLERPRSLGWRSVFVARPVGYGFCYSFSGQKRAFKGREAGTDAR